MGKERQKVNSGLKRQRYSREFKLEAVRLPVAHLVLEFTDIDLQIQL